MLLTISINDVDVGMNNIINKIADDTKTGNSVLIDGDMQRLQRDLHKNSSRSDRGRRPFNWYQVIQVGTRNKFHYEMRGVTRKRSVQGPGCQNPVKTQIHTAVHR